MASDDAFSALNLIITDQEKLPESDRNEAQTRFDIIDRVLKEVLEWPHDRISVEDRVEDGFTDYQLRDQGALAVVEAKREGIGFQLPSDARSGVCSLRPFLGDKSNAELKKAMSQALGYSSQLGVAPTVVTNGRQWVAFLGSRNDGIPPLEGKAMVFPSLSDIRDNFMTFYESLSWDGLRSRKIFSTLSSAVTAPPSPLAASLSDYPGTKRRNPLQSNLQILGELILEDIPTEETYSQQFIEECYASSGALSAYSEMSKELLTSRSSAILQEQGTPEAPAATKKGLNPELSEESLAAAASHRPIVLIGGVGVGKTTFIQHLMRVDAPGIFQNAVTITVNYGAGATFGDPREYALERIHEDLYEVHGIDVYASEFVEDLYRRDLERFDRSVDGQLKKIDPTTYAIRRLEYLKECQANSAEHLRRAIERIIRSRRRQVIIFLDNVDQRDHVDQNKVFLAANELAAKWAATVFVSLRPETYYESLRYGAISGYHPRLFSIAPPRTEVMLKKRIEFALKVLEIGGDIRTTRPSVGIASENLQLFLRVLLENVSRNRPLMLLIENLSGGNMRRALGFITQFVGSGHVDTEKIIGVERRDPGDYVIPVHEFLRAILHGDNEYYDPQTSPIANLFAIDRPEPRDHFLLPIMLEYVMGRGEAKDSSGFIKVTEVYENLQRFGYSVDECVFSLNYAAKFRLIEAPLSDFDAANSEKVRITSVGVYSVKHLMSQFTYCDAVVVDTPILEPEARGGIAKVYTIGDRLDRVEIFRKYLDDCWTVAALGAPGWEWSTVSERLKQDIERVRSKVNP